MNDNNFVSNFGPPPQPKLIKIDQPKHTVPDVTLLFDSNDSYLWKASSGSKNVVESPKEKLESPNTNLGILSQKETVPELKSSYGQYAFPRHKNLLESYHQNFGSQNVTSYQSNKNVYDPEVYSSPVLHTEKETSIFLSDKDKNCNGQIPVANNNRNPSIVPILNTEIKLNEIKQDVFKSGKDPLTSQMKYHCYNKKHYVEANESSKKNYLHDNSTHINKYQYNDLCEENNLLLISKNQNVLIKDKVVADNTPKHKIDRHVLKILEEQKLQISQLQDVVEKVLNQKINNADSKNENSDKSCFCNFTQSPNIEPEKRKVAIVQTSFIENPATRTVATNTDLTMNDISLFLYNQTKLNTNSTCIRKNNSLKVVCKNSIIENPIRDLIQSKQEKGNNLNIEKLNEEGCEIVPSKDINTNEEYCEYESEANEHPFFGESARNLNKKYSEEEESSEVLHKDEINNLTCYNNIQINIQQKFLHRAEPAAEQKEEELHLVNSDPSVQQVEQQLQNFGISFLDPVTLRHKRDDRHAPELPSPFSFYPNYQLEAALGSYDRAVLPSRNHESPIRNWRNVQMMLNKKYVSRNCEENSVLTSSTIQFINKHGLKK